MQKYLNEMSENGFHLVKLTKFKSVFSEEVSKRYIYSLCPEGEERVYAPSSGWEHFFTFKEVLFFRKEVPADAVVKERDFSKKKTSVEVGWLNARLGEGLKLIGLVGHEYIFCRDPEAIGYEYKILAPRKKKGKEDGNAVERLGDVSGMVFITVNDAGEYYFIKDAKIKNAVIENRGKRLSDQLLALFIATGSALIFCASVLLALFGAFTAKANGLSILPWVLGGGASALVFAVLFVAFYLRFQKIAEARKIRAEEKRLAEQRAAEQQKEDTPEAPQQTANTNSTNNNNTVVMNTVVLNTYGKDGKAAGEEFDPNLRAAMGQVFDGISSPAVDPSQNPAISAAKNPQELAEAVMRAAAVGPAQYEDKTGESDDIWQGTGIFGSPKPLEITGASAPIYTEEQTFTPELPATEEIDEEEEYELEEEPYEEEEEYDEEELPSFSLIGFIGNALLCFLAVVMLSFGVRYAVSWFTGAVNDVLMLSVAIICAGFSPFVFMRGLNRCRELLSVSDYDDGE